MDPDAAAQATSMFGEDDPSETDERLAKRRPRRLIAALAVVAVAAAAVVVRRPWAADDPTPEPVLVASDRWVLDAPGDFGFTLTASTIEDGADPTDEGRAVGGVAFFAPGASIEAGPLVVVLFSAGNDGPVDQRDDVVEVKGQDAQVDRDVDGLRLQFTFEGDTWEVEAYGVDLATAVAVAEAVEFDDDGVASTDRSNVPDGLEATITVEEVWSLGTLLAPHNSEMPVDLAVTQVEYHSNDGQVLKVGSILWNSSDSDAALTLLLPDAEPIEIDGRAALIANESFVDPEGSATTIAFVVGDRLVVVHGDLPADELVRFAESIRPATDEEWEDVLEVADNSPDPESFGP